ncbi:MAG: hypothetical protein J6W03_07940 [Bacteroidaceae bacterium]|nr:hypothetical protein [Bacteroidaceae bacterium]
MKNIKLLAFLLLLAPCPLALKAQTAGTVSPYSRFGLGLLREQSQGFNTSMGGVGAGIRVGNRINTLNPASYSAIDSLSFILDVGMSGSFGRMRQGSKQVGINNATLDYVHAGMHIAKRLGLAVGYMPYTTIGYDFSSPEEHVINDYNTTQDITTSTGYVGHGGLNQAYIGLGWKAFKNFSIGMNASLLWGQYEHQVMPLFMEGGVVGTTFNQVIKVFNASLKTYKLDFGVQYPVRLTRQDWLTFGATAGLGHKIAQDATLMVSTDTMAVASSPFDIPYTYGVGAAWQHKNTLLVAADFRQEFWSACHVPFATQDDYVAMKGFYRNKTKVAVGAQWTPNVFGKYWERIQYRAGMNFSTPYLKVDGANGPTELRMTIGAGLPITNRFNNRSVVNVGMQWLRRSASAAGMIKEDYFVINLGMTFNERWFMRYKIE